MGFKQIESNIYSSEFEKHNFPYYGVLIVKMVICRKFQGGSYTRTLTSIGAKHELFDHFLFNIFLPKKSFSFVSPVRSVQRRTSPLSSDTFRSGSPSKRR